MRCRVLVLCAVICLFVLLVEGRQRKVNRSAARTEAKESRSLGVQNRHRNIRRSNNNNARQGNRLSARSNNQKRRRLNAAKRNKRSRNLAKKSNRKHKSTSSVSSGSSYATIPLDFKPNFVRTTDNLRADKAFVANRYGGSFAKSSGTARLTNTGNMEYTCKMTAGTPKQTFTVLPDTGSSNIWLPGPHCNSKACRNHNRYRPGKSSTFVKMGTKFAIEYGSGAVQGVLAKDRVGVAGLSVANQTFAMTTKEPGSTFVDALFDGILGLGYQSISVDNVRTLVQNMCSQSVISTCKFAICMKGGGSSTRGGVIIFGSTDTSTYTGSNSYSYTPVTRKGYWQFALEAFYVGSTRVSGTSQAIVDSGTSLIAAPCAIYHRINKIIGCTETSSGECWMKCSRAIPDFTFVINGKKFVIPGNKMKMRVRTNKGNTVCISVVSCMDTDFWILGDPYMRNYCTVFDMSNNRIGFASST
ncbi:lysosomal aspartic protease [Drosophila serrata]|uniref:lysosomal aspartic protease n=1 Tax=Drosophila serrata TaxID=7274 RepID=UPI000A1D0770|nr:lysosomal aspartic protease [Drosophila serrata]